MTINRQLLDERIEYIAQHPEEHYQGAWAVRKDGPEGENLLWPSVYHERPEPACGTAFCLAGHVVGTLPGVKFIWDSFGKASTAWAPNLEQFHIGTMAEELLGLTTEQADAIFDGGNTLDEIRALRDEFYAAEDEGRDWRDVRPDGDF